MSSTDDKVEGTIDIIKGKAKKVWGEVTNDDSAKAEGTVDKIKGNLKKAKGDLKDLVKGKVDDV
jgi:uncharacterized protein YjbJ (UPF0337 family)